MQITSATSNARKQNHIWLVVFPVVATPSPPSGGIIEVNFLVGGGADLLTPGRPKYGQNTSRIYIHIFTFKSSWNFRLQVMQHAVRLSDYVGFLVIPSSLTANGCSRALLCTKRWLGGFAALWKSPTCSKRGQCFQVPSALKNVFRSSCFCEGLHHSCSLCLVSFRSCLLSCPWNDCAAVLEQPFFYNGYHGTTGRNETKWTYVLAWRDSPVVIFTWLMDGSRKFSRVLSWEERRNEAGRRPRPGRVPWHYDKAPFEKKDKERVPSGNTGGNQALS